MEILGKSGQKKILRHFALSQKMLWRYLGGMVKLEQQTAGRIEENVETIGGRYLEVFQKVAVL